MLRKSSAGLDNSNHISFESLRSALKAYINKNKTVDHKKYFKDSKDIFLGVPKASIRKIAKEFCELSLKDILELLKSDIHDERSLACVILCIKFKKGDDHEKKEIVEFYIKNRKLIKDWDAVDDTAPYILGLVSIEL